MCQLNCILILIHDCSIQKRFLAALKKIHDSNHDKESFIIFHDSKDSPLSVRDLIHDNIYTKNK